MLSFIGDYKFTNDEILPLVGKIKGIIYARVSTSDQVDKYSLSTQVEECAEFAYQKFGYTDDDLISLIEEGESGDDPNRPALNNALMLLEKGVGKKLIVLHPDRLSRSLSLQTRVSERIWSLGCDIEFKQFELDPNNPESVLMYNIQGSIAQYNKAKILANSKRGRIKKIQEKKLMGIKRVYGYSYDKDNDTLVINEEEKEVFLSIVDMLLNQDMSISAIAKELSKNMIPAPLGNVWYQSTISKMLKNEIYTGKFYYGKTTFVKDKDGKRKKVDVPKKDWMLVEIPAIIDESTFRLIQKKIKALTKMHTGRPSEHGLIKGLARCGRCGYSVTINSTSKLKERTLYYYGCTRKGKKGYVVGTGEPNFKSCRGRNWRVDLVDKAVWEEVKKVIKAPKELIKKLEQEQNDAQAIQKLNQKRSKLVSLTEEKQRIYERYIDLYANGLIKTKEELESKISPIQTQLDEIQLELDVINERLQLIQMKYDELKMIELRLMKFNRIINEDRVPPDLKRSAIQSLVKQVILNEDGTAKLRSIWGDTSLNFLKETEEDNDPNTHEKLFLNQGKGIHFHVDIEMELPKPKWGGDDFERKSSQYQDQLDKLVKMYQEELKSFIEMEKETGIDWWTIRDLFEQNGIPIMSKEEIYKRRRDRDFHFLYDLHFNKDLTLKQIYKDFGYSPVYVRRVFKEHGVEPIKRNQFGAIKPK
jgi:site-specific DNA recombinase